ncbi:MAG: hypothetical protein IKR57_01215 [Bacilli bacterium]|nr:hypothetical protein [Bacilli bacterium]
MNDNNNQNLFVPNDDGNIVMQNSTPDPVMSQPVMNEPQSVVQPQEPVFSPTPSETPAPNPMEQNSFLNPQPIENSQPMNDPIPSYSQNMTGQSDPNGTNGSNNKMVLIIVGVVVLIAIGLILYFTLFKKSDETEYTSYEDYEKELEKTKERINNNFEIKQYDINNGILVELNNKNKEIVNADIKIEFYDETGNPVGVENGYMFYVPGQGKGYEKVSTYGVSKYSTYKVTAKLDDASSYTKTYNDKVKIVSNNAQEYDLIFQVKNEADVKLKSIEVGVMFLGQNNTILDFGTASFTDLAPGETTTGKVSIPYDYDKHKNMNYEKVEFKILSATTSIE